MYLEDIATDGPEMSAVPWTGVAPDGSPVIMRNVGSRELYSLELPLP